MKLGWISGGVDCDFEKRKEGYKILVDRGIFCMIGMYMHHLGFKVDMGEVKQLDIHFEDDNSKKCEITFRKKNVLGSSSVHCEFSVDAFLKSDEYQRRLMIMDVIYASCKFLCKYVNRETEPFDTAYQKCLDENLDFKVMSKKQWNLRNSRFAVRIEYAMDMETFSADCLLLDRDDSSIEFGRKRFIDIRPVLAFGIDFIRKAKWLDKTHFGISPRMDSKGFPEWTVDFTDEMAAVKSTT